MFSWEIPNQVSEKTHATITPNKIKNKSFLSSKYPGHVKIFLIASKMSFKVGFGIYIPTVQALYLIDLLRSGSLVQGRIMAKLSRTYSPPGPGVG